MDNLSYIIKEVTEKGSCPCPNCKKGIIYPNDRNKPAKDQHIFTCDYCGGGANLSARIIVE